MARLVHPNQCEALAVDARQELDLKVGPAGDCVTHRRVENGSCHQLGRVARCSYPFLTLCFPPPCFPPRAQVGVAFTRFQSRFFQAKYGNLDSAGGWAHPHAHAVGTGSLSVPSAAGFWGQLLQVGG